MIFHGFPTGLPDFLIELKFTNTLENLPDNKARYKEFITLPLTELHADLTPMVQSISDQLDTKPSRCISTPYTDRRFSPLAPLKEYLYLRFKATHRETDIPGLYFDLGSDYYSYGLRIYNQTSGGMANLREKILQKPERWDEKLIELTQQGYSLIGERFKQDHFLLLSDSPVKNLLNHRTFYIGRDEPVSKVIFSSTLFDTLKTGFNLLGPILDLLL